VINNSATYGSYEVAILKAFSGAINLYSNNGTPTSYYPLTVNSSNKAVELPCP
jgi:hypothetical protein